MTSPRLRSAFAVAVVTVAALAVWEVAARVWLIDLGVAAAPSQVVAELATQGDMYLRNAGATGAIALQGWVLGNAAAIVVGAVFVLSRAAESLFLRLALTLHVMPLVAVMPILQLTFPAETAKVLVAALAVFFTTVVGTMLGLRSAEQGTLTMVHAWGGGTFAKLRLVRVPSSVPSVVAGLQIGVAAAVLGAIFSEFIGARTGLGVLLINGLAMLDQPQVYAVAVVATVMATVPYALLGIAAKRFTGWSSTLSGATATPPSARRGGAARVLATIASGFVSLLIIVAGWWLYLIVFQVSPFVGKTPVDVYRYLFVDEGAAETRAAMLTALGETLIHAGVGFVAGLLLGVVAAVLFDMFRPLELALTPLTVALRSVPIIALVPVLILAFGRGLGGVVAITGIVTFFPTLANTRTGLSRVPHDAQMLMRSYASDRLTLLWRLQLPVTLPAIFASARIAAPTAILAATLAEWLATGNGLGYYIVVSRAHSDYTGLWAGATILVAVSLVFYSLVAALERAVLTRFAPTHVQ